MAQQTGRTEGFWLSVPVDGQVNSIIVPVTSGVEHLPNATTMDEAIIDAEDISRVAFVQAGYETTDTIYATLYQIGSRGELVHSECFPISGPDAE